MNDLVGLLITWLILTISFVILSKLPIGVEIDNFKRALFAAAVFGILNAFVGPVLRFLAIPITFLTLGAFTIVINAIIFGLAAALVAGFRLRWGIWSALLGALGLSIINSLLTKLLTNIIT